MNINIGYSNNRKDKCNKTFTGKTLTGKLKENTSLMNPSIIVQEPIATLSGYNYFSMNFNGVTRYYFITSISSLTSELVQITGHCDVLSGDLWKQLKNCTGIVTRSENSSIYNLYLDDPCFKVESRVDLYQWKFSSTPLASSKDSYILIVGGVA